VFQREVFHEPRYFSGHGSGGIFPPPSVLVCEMTRTEDLRGGVLEARLAGRRDELVAQWTELIFGTYPEETRKIWQSNLDRFTNPWARPSRDRRRAL
jgi:hypothetical protein